jgi:hypothetical protein
MQISPALSPLLKKAAANAPAVSFLTPTSLAFILALSVASAGLAWFLQTASARGMIFRFWRKLIFGLWWKGRARRVRYEDYYKGKLDHTYYAPEFPYPIHLLNPTEKELKHWTTRTYWQPAKWWRMFYKPLGGCIYCNGPWLLMPYFFGLTVGLLGWPWLLALAIYPLAVGVQYACIELLNDFAK